MVKGVFFAISATGWLDYTCTAAVGSSVKSSNPCSSSLGIPFRPNVWVIVAIFGVHARDGFCRLDTEKCAPDFLGAFVIMGYTFCLGLRKLSFFRFYQQYGSEIFD